MLRRIFCFFLLAGYLSLGYAQPENRLEEPAGKSKSSSAAKTLARTLTVTNQCKFDVWLQSVGSNASSIPCSPNTQSAQANCPSGFICYKKSTNASYCVAGTTTVTKFPIKKQSDITLAPNNCTSDAVVTDKTSDLWGQCTCAASSGCASNQQCQPVTSKINQCFWSVPLPDNGKVKSGGSVPLTIKIDSTLSADAMIAGGKFYAKLACDVNGKCLADNTLGAPATLIEYTFQNNNDWYDISYINGISPPATMYPVPAKNLDYSSTDPYRCMAAGGDKKTIKEIKVFQKAKGITGNSTLEPFACTNDYKTVFDKTLSGFNFVTPSTTACSSQSSCATGQACGLSLTSVTSGGTGTTCGNRLGYWTYAQFCAANASYKNTDLGIDCSNATNYAYASCTAGTKSNTGAGRSCFNSTTTSSGDSCCGYEAWSNASGAQPMGKGDAAVAGVVTTNWTTNILPAVKPVKKGCFLAYAYQFDDPYSTFTCATTSKGTVNTANYNITLCPSGTDAGINPPAPNQCVAAVPAGYQSNEYNVGVPAKITLSVYSCDSAGNNCTTAQSPTPAGSSLFTVTMGGIYKINATHGTSSQSCKFNIPKTGCITRVSTSQQCMNWQLPTGGAWKGRDISIPSF
jgi:hypothetical protein